MRPGISICAVTFRRPAGLARLLASLARLKLPDGTLVEAVIVDNDPRGSAFGRPDRPEQLGALPLLWLHGGRGDIAHARNLAARAAGGEWLALIDDDEEAHEDWLLAYQAMAERCPADAFFGPVQPRLEAPGRDWLDLPTFYARRRFPTGSQLGLYGPCTANAFVRWDLLQRHPFDPAFGRTLGEDTECFLRARAAGARLVWCDEAVVDEWIPPARHRPGWLAHRALEGACAWAHIERRHAPRSRARTGLAGLARAGAALALLPFAALGGRRAALQAWLRVCVQAGRLWGWLGGDVRRRGD